MKTSRPTRHAATLADLPEVLDLLTQPVREELLLTISQSFLAVVMIASRDLRGWEAITLLALFLGQVASPTIGTRNVFTGVYVVLAVALLVVSREHRRGLVASLRFVLTGAHRE